MSNLLTFTDRATWLVARRDGIGGSDVPAILGLSRWKTPLQVWSEKVGLTEPSEPEYVQRRGHYMEDFLRDELARETGLVVKGLTLAIARHEAHPCLAYSPDGLVCGPDGATAGIAEFKTRQAWTRDEWSDGIPPDVAAQVQHGMDVLGVAQAWVGVDLGTEFRWARVERDDALIALRRPLLLDFWKLVETQTPPEPTGAEGDKALLGKMYAEPSGETIPLDGEFLDVAQTIAECDETMKRCAEKKAELENRVRAALGEAERGVLPDGSWWSWKKQSRPKMVPDPTAPRSEFRVLRRGGAKGE